MTSPPVAAALPINLPPPLPAEEQPYLGYSIVKGRFRFLSVSQIVHYDIRQHGGCPRKWAFEKVFRKKEVVAADDPRNKGKHFAREGELWLKYAYDALSPVMRAGKHLLPKPGADLEVEEAMAGSKDQTIAALALRDRILTGERISNEEIERVAGLALHGIPLIGAFDYGHQRGYYITEGGVLVKEPHEHTFEIGDHKVVARIRDHVTKPRRGGQPVTLQGYAKTPEEIGAHPQMLGYGVRTKIKHPHIEWVRLGHNYYQSRNGHTADKRSILMPVSQIIDRWRGDVGPIVLQMIDSAQAEKPEDVPFNLKSCKAFNRECPHMAYCERPARSFNDFCADAFGDGGANMDLSALFPGSNTNGAQAHTPATPVTQTTAPVAPQTDEERARAIEAEKAKLAAQQPMVVQARRHPLEGIDGYTVGQPCNGRGFYQQQNGDRSGFVGVEPGHTCSACVQAPVLPTVASVNPADAPRVDFIAQSDPLTPEAIAEIADPELRTKAEAHAKAWAERKAAEDAARAAAGNGKKTSSTCAGVGQRLPLGNKEMLSRRAKCPGCHKEIKIKDADIDLAANPIVFVVPKHKLAEVPAAAPAQAPATPPAAPVVAPAAPQMTPAQVEAYMPVASLTPQVPTLPPPLPVAPSTPMTVQQVEQIISDGVKTSALPSTLFLNTVFTRGNAPKNLDEYARDLVKTLQTAAKLDDLRYAPDGHELGFGRWKGALTKMVKANPLPAGEYALYVGGSEVRDVVAEAVADMLDARVVRGAS